jgi:putative cell wall-binding protein
MTNEEIAIEMDIRLQKFADDLIIWAEEIKNCKSLMVPFDILASHEREKGSKRYRDNYELIFLFFYLYKNLQ